MTEAFASKVTYYLGGTEFRSNRDLAEAAGISPRTIRRIRAGTASVKPDTAIRLKTALLVPQEGEAEFFLLAYGHPEKDVDHATGRKATAFRAMQLIHDDNFRSFTDRLAAAPLSPGEGQRLAEAFASNAVNVAATVIVGRPVSCFPPQKPSLVPLPFHKT